VPVRPTLKASNAAEAIALRLDLAPVPVGEALFGQPLARTVMAGVRLGVFKRLAKGDATTEELSTELELTPTGTKLLLNGLAASGHVDLKDGRWKMTRGSKRWLDPASDTYVGTFIEHCYDYWGWWDRLEDVLREGSSVEIHGDAPDDPHWRRYIVGQFELARLSAPEVAKKLRLPDSPRRLLDVAGGHGWFSASLCKRHPTLAATVLDLPGSAAIGRELIADAGMSDRVEHVEGDMLETELEQEAYDGALVFNIIHHLSPEDCLSLLKRVTAALKPGGTLAVLDLFLPRAGTTPDSAAFLGLFFHLTSGAATYAPEDLHGWLKEAGYAGSRKITIRRIPGQSVYEARKPG
jgi:2-polyprenyl-3-methyl-5-hydroxy-6-metoxy-1,4-benzoquinol methylase